MDAASIVGLAVVSAFYLLVAYREGRTIRTVEDFFLATRKLKKRKFFGAYSGTNVTFTAVFLYLTAEGVKSGNIPLAAAPFWWAGVVFFWWNYPRIASFCKNGFTLHEYLGEAFSSQKVRRVASLVTIASFVAGVSLEFYGFAWILETLSGQQLPWELVGVVLLIALVAYTAYGGFPATVATDLLQVALIMLGLGALFWYALIPAWSPQLASEVLDWRNLFSDPLFLLAYFVLFFPFQFSVMDGWQRCAAAGGEENVVRPAALWGGLAVGAVFLLPVILGISTASEVGASDPLNALVIAIERVPAGIMTALVMVSFLSSLFSTADTLLLNAAYSLVYDLHVGYSDERVSPQEFSQSTKMVPTMRLWIAILGACAMLGFGILFIVPLSAFILAALSSQAILGVLVLYHFWAGDKAKRRGSGAHAAILTCFVSAILVVGSGLGLGDQQLIDGAAFVAVVLAAVAFFVFPKTKVKATATS